ncbi:copper uptake system-associated protein [Tritonibacter mobilis]|uniref:copper uptake system-associated protein n=1 Tax=Tritonibacter mobilis TaxID=379347 RepID=UPI001C095FE0|nr:copper uptake system-associated protein [Tritonibacter mobilis]MBU3033773.1 copper uptake system-associated protein [Tritonibacter mobilis]WHQ84826.1 copper uptake system-associated protein [Tritonibacter mobilis]
MKTLLIAGALVALAGSVSAHSTLEQSEAKAGATTKITLRVPHGCKGEATHTVRLSLPDGFYAARPMPKAGWDLTTTIGAYATPYDNHGTQMTEGVREVVWSAGNLEDGWYDEFTVRGTLGADIAPDTVMFFPAMQECANGTADWTDTSGSHDVPNPAPKLTVVAGEGGHGHGHGAMAGHTLGPVTAGDLEITGGFSRATLPNAPVGGGFMTIMNTGSEDERLVGASSSAAGHMEVHEMAMEGDVMKMRELADGLPIPAGQTVELKPGGFHIMFMELKEPLVEGETVNVTLAFEKAGEVEVPLIIGKMNAKGHGSMDHSGHGMKAEDHGDNAHGADDMPSHAAPAAFDQASIHGDAARIDGLLRATFETAEARLTLAPLLIAGDHAMVGWVQEGRGGRAMLSKDGHGIWTLTLCGGAAIKGQAAFEALGVPAVDAATLAEAQESEEAKLDHHAVMLMDSFGETVRF